LPLGIGVSGECFLNLSEFITDSKLEAQ